MASDEQTPEFMRHMRALKWKNNQYTNRGICGPKKFLLWDLWIHSAQIPKINVLPK